MDTAKKLRIKPWWVALIVIGVGLGAYFGVKSNSTSHQNSLSGLKTINSFSLKNSQGKSVSINEFKDSIVIVHFWATWCPPCIPELPEVIGAAKRLPQDRNGKNIYWILISQDESYEKTKTILDEATLPKNTILLLDPEAKISDLFGTYQFPETYVLSKKREILAKWIGPQDWSGQWGENALEGIQQFSLR